MIALEKDTDDTPFCQITSHLSHTCVYKSGWGVCASNIEDSESDAFFAFFSPAHSILLMGFRVLLYLQATKHSSSNEANTKYTELNSPQTTIFCLSRRTAAFLGVHRPHNRRAFLWSVETSYRNPTSFFTSWHTGHANSLALADPICKTFSKWSLSIFSFSISLLIGANFSITASATSSL